MQGVKQKISIAAFKSGSSDHTTWKFTPSGNGHRPFSPLSPLPPSFFSCEGGLSLHVANTIFQAGKNRSYDVLVV